MSQPKLSNQTITPLLTIGPFDGIDATTDPYWIDGTYARDGINFVPNHAYRGLAPIRGRRPGTFALPANPTSLAIFYPPNNPPALVTNVQGGGFFQEAIFNSGLWQPIPVPPAPSGDTITGKAGAFARYRSWLFFSNNDPNDICYKFDKNYNATFWGISPPKNQPPVSTTSPNNGMIYGDAYYYRYTYAADQATDPGLNQESSPSPPAGPFDIGTPLGPPTSGSATIGQSPAPTLAPDQSGGTIPNGTYFIGTTWVTPAGEEGISQISNVTVTGAPPDYEIFVTPQSPPVGATGWNVYVGTSSIGLTQQGGTRSGTGGAYVFNYTLTGGPPPTFTGILGPPPTPILKTTAGGSLPARTEYYEITYVNTNGETVASGEASINVGANELVVVKSPAADANATGWNVYGSLTSAQEILQNASPIAIGTNYTEPTIGLTLGQSGVLTVTGSPDPQVTSINVYRIGGQSLGNWYFVGSIPNPGGSTTATFTDNTPDDQVTGQALVLARDPPAPFGAVFLHLDRMMGFGYKQYTDFNNKNQPGRPCDLWYSNYAEPWGFDNTNQVLPVGAEDAGDIAVNGASLAGIAMLWKTKTTWALYGSSPSDFFVAKLFDVGAAAHAGCFVALGVAFWLSRQGMYMFDGSTLTYLSKPIKRILDGFSNADFEAATGCFDDRMAWWSFPTQNVSLGYDTVSQNWFKSSLYTPLFAFDTEAPSRPTAPDYVFGANPDGFFVDQWFAATTDLGQPITSTLLTRLVGSGPQIGTLRARYIELIASANITPGDQVTVSVTANPGSTARSFGKTFTQSPVNLRIRASVPPGIQGDEMQLQITAVTSDQLVLDGAALHGWTRRLYNVVGN